MTADQKIVIDLYKEIYKLNKESKNLSPDEILAKRQQMKPYFEAIKAEAEAKKNAYSERSQMATAYGYFLNNYAGLTLFLTNYLVPIDNNSSERLLRSHVVGRKTWYGTHSRAGARAAAIHFTIIESVPENILPPHASDLGELTIYGTVRRYEEGPWSLSWEEADIGFSVASEVLNWATGILARE